MKKKSMLKRMAAVFMGTVMLLGTAGAVSAATAPDLSGQGSLQIFKQDENNFISQRGLLCWDTPSRMMNCSVI